MAGQYSAGVSPHCVSLTFSFHFSDKVDGGKYQHSQQDGRDTGQQYVEELGAVNAQNTVGQKQPLPFLLSVVAKAWPVLSQPLTLNSNTLILPESHHRHLI